MLGSTPDIRCCNSAYGKRDKAGRNCQRTTGRLERVRELDQYNALLHLRKCSDGFGPSCSVWPGGAIFRITMDQEYMVYKCFL